MSLIYLDNNATTRLDPLVLEAMMPLLTEHWGNPGSSHSAGRPVAKAVHAARRSVASRFGLEPGEIIFAASATEADNLALRGIISAAPEPRHLITTAVEHPAVLDCARALQSEGLCSLTVLAVDGRGRLDLDELRAAMRPGQTRLVSVMGANNETGVLFPIPEIAEIVHEAGALLHVDAVQLIGKVDAAWTRWPVDLFSLSAHKFHGPKGVGLLTAPRRVPMQPVLVGGGQERGLRSGTENPAGIVGIAQALELALDASGEAVERMRGLRDRLEASLVERVEGLVVTGVDAARNANTSHLTIAGIEAEPVLVQLDREGIAVSAGSACSSGALEASHVLKAMGIAGDRIHGVLRISLSRESTGAEIERVVGLLPGVVERVRSA
ncbi:cysteine desulfurase NifS [bacterium]|nr:MAG: cysteine desulfurase NifS [bacterium]RKZ14846.1 MAG: cysteine desulfurase NifS [bacterium]